MRNALPTRRQLIRAALTTAAVSSALTVTRSAFAHEKPRFLSDPFTLGIASGDPSPDGAVIWTRLAPMPFEANGGLSPAPLEVIWEIAADDRFRKIAYTGTTVARAESAHTVHVELQGLPPATQWFYRFHCGPATSQIGRFTTAPAFGTKQESFRIAWTGCQHFEQGFFNAYQDLADQNPDLVIHTGDYIYESSWGPQIRRHAVSEPESLADYRITHALYKTDQDLQRAHATAPWLFIWDDHEVDNDYAGNISEQPDVDPKAFFKRRVAAYRAYFEHQPLRQRARLSAAGEMRIWGQSSFGNLADIYLTDGRQYRSPAACPTETDRGGNLVPSSCPDLTAPDRTYLGAAQERWLDYNFGRGPATWNILVQPTLFSNFHGPEVNNEPAVWTDGWSGYPAARQRLTDIMGRRAGSNPIVLGGDTHCYWVAEIPSDHQDPTSKPVGAEFVTTSITSLRTGYERISAFLPDNPHIHHFDNREHGYGLLDLYQDRAEIDLRVVKTPRTRAGASAHSQAKYVVTAGTPKVQPA